MLNLVSLPAEQQVRPEAARPDSRAPKPSVQLERFEFGAAASALELCALGSLAGANWARRATSGE